MTHIPSRRAFTILATSLLLAVSAPALAHGPTRQKVIEKVTINAPADTVWAAIKNFDAIKNWHPAVAESPADKGNEVGSVRTIKLKTGGTLIETIEGYNDAQKKYNYRLKDGSALPVSNYTSAISVTGDGNKSEVEWRGAFYRGYPNNDPPPDRNDEAALKAVTEVFRSGLDNLKKQLESK
jgi:carbon monoxide dehydrogenase subunit G